MNLFRTVELQFISIHFSSCSVKEPFYLASSLMTIGIFLGPLVFFWENENGDAVRHWRISDDIIRVHNCDKWTDACRPIHSFIWLRQRGP